MNCGAEYNFCARQGLDKELEIKLKNSDGTYIDFTNYTLTMPFRFRHTGGKFAFELTNGDGLTISTTAIRIKISNTITDSLEVGNYYYNLDTLENGDKSNLIYGYMEIKEKVAGEIL